MRKLPEQGKGWVIAVAVAVMVYSFPGFAQTECPSFPKIKFWSDMTHESVRQHVEDKLGGDWIGYLNQLQHQHTALSNIHEKGSGAVINRKGRKIRLSGDQLAKYLRLTKRRMSVVQCLAETEEAKNFDGFSTAAGNPEEFASTSSRKPKASKKRAVTRTFVKIPNKLLAKLRKMAVRQSLKEARQVGVDEIIVKILKRDLKKRKR